MANSKRRCSLKSCDDPYFRPEDGIIGRDGKLAFCKFDHQVQYGLETGKKLRAKKVKQESVDRKKAFYADDLPHQKALTQTVCNKLVSLLDAGKTCISCGRPLRGGRFQNASHLKSVGSNSFLRYSPVNIHMACVNCNEYQSGNIEGYKVGLVERYGQSMLDYLESAPRVKAWTCEELLQLRTDMNAEIRALQKDQPATRNWRALPQVQEQQAA
jgi:hypothetical protein